MSNHPTRTSPNEAARQKLWWRKPRSVMTNALHHDGLETYPGCPPIPCLKLRGLWIHALGIEPGTRLYVDTKPGAILLTVEETVAPDTASVAYRRSVGKRVVLDTQ
jgi:toxic protein SymE